MGRPQGFAGYGRIARIGAIVICCLALANCGRIDSTIDPRYGVAKSRRLVEPGQPVPKGGGVYRVGHPYVVGGRTYVPREDPDYSAFGLASWYGRDFHGRETANGEIYDMHSISAAHPTLPIPSYARVTNLSNGRSIIVRVNDRGPYVGNRIIDVSVRAAKLLGFYGHGLAHVRVDYVGRAPLSGTDDRMLLATLRHGSPAPSPRSLMVASAKPFVPDFGASRRRVPVPDERPFTLGETDVRTARGPSRVDVATLPQPAPARTKLRTVAVSAAAKRSARAGSTQAASTASPDTRFATRWAAEVPSSGSLAEVPTVPATPSPVSAYAPSRYNSAPGYVSGRGLY
jgi:peptidoglycan lytic transglycosylase